MLKNSPKSVLNFKMILVFIFMIALSSVSFGQTDTYNSVTPGTGTWTRPANVTHVTLEAWGGGGGGGGATNSNGATGGGGGGGGYARLNNKVATATINYTLGAGGTAGSNANGGNGGNTTSTFGLNTITAAGGSRGLRSANGAGGAGGTLNFGDVTFNGGSGYQGVDGTRSGAGGGSGGGGGAGGNGLAAGTGGAAGIAGSFTAGAAGANSVSANGTTGVDGSIPGSGGSGARGASGAGGARAGGVGGSGQIIFRYISVSSISPTPVCIGTTITITGTNFATTGSTTVSVGGTLCTSVTVVSATQITAVIAPGTTSGTVVVTNPNGMNNGQTLTVNPSTIPSISTQPVATSICSNSSGSFSVVATGAASYQWRRNGVNLTNTAPYSGATTATLTITNPALAIAGNFDVVISNAAGCSITSNTVALTVNATPGITTNPTNSTITSGSNTSFSVVATNSPTNYTWEVSTNGGGAWTTVTNGGVYSNATTATLNITAAPVTMDGYLYRVTASNSCGSITSTQALLTITLAYCTSSGDTVNAFGIKRVTFNTIDNTPSGTAVNVAYSDYTTVSTTVTKGTTYTLSAFIDTLGNYTAYQSAYIDWNRDGDFLDADEYYDLGHVRNVAFGLTGNSPYPITIPLNAATGSVRMRIQCKYNSKTTGPCETGFIGEVEDYTLNIVTNASACSTPTAQPSTLLLASANGASITGSFTAASPAADHYLVVRSTSSTPPTLTPSTFYTIGSTIGAGYTVVDNDNNTSFLATGLTANTLYYIYVFSYNGTCTGGPLYNTTSPLTGNITTANNSYCVPTSLINTNYISGITSIGTLNDMSNNPTGYSSNGYGNYTSLTIARQIPGGGINININLSGSLGQFIYAYVDWNNNGSFADAGETVYTTGTTATGDTSFGFVVPAAQAAGNYRMRIRTRSFGDDSTINSCAQGYTTGETEDYTIAVQADCAQKITSVTNGSACGPTNTVSLSAVSAGATGFRWYSTETGATLIQQVVGSGNWTTPSISSTTTYYVTAYNGTCESLYRTPVVATIKPTTNITVTPSTPTVCGEGTIISVTAGGDTITEDVLLQDFESGLGTWTVATPTNTNAGADTPWSVKTSTYQPTTTTVWRPAVNSGAVATTGNRFAFTTSDYTNSNIVTIMTSPVIDATVYSNLTLTFDHYYSYYGGDKGEVQVSIDGGGTWPNTVKTYNSDIGSASKFVSDSIDLSAFAGQTNLRIRFVYTGNWDDGWALDNFKLTGVKPLNTTFTWSGGSVNAYIDNPPTIPYVAQSVSTIYLLPTTSQLEQANWSLTATATLGNGCPVSKVISVTNNTKTWKGTIDNNWNNAGNWAPNVVPDANSCVIIPNATNSQIMNTPNALAKNLTVKGTGNLELQSGRNLTVTDWINVESGATFNVRNSANLVQVTESPVPSNSGIINMQRTAFVDTKDYVYWSSPVAGFNSANISLTSSNNHLYKWLPTTGGVNGFGNWTSGVETMVIGQGYIERGLNSAPLNSPVNFTSTFIGTPNNGTLTTPISRGTYSGVNYNTGVSTTPATDDDDNWNLLGNPYPSSISAADFLNANSTNLDGFVKIWTHGIPPTTTALDPFYNNYGYNYDPNDYITWNLSGPSTPGFSGYIGAGQGFITKMKHTSPTTSSTAVFNNSMRNASFTNSEFYKSANQKTSIGNSEGRIWIDLVSSNASTRALIAYVDGATDNRDQMYDAQADLKTNFRINSLLGQERLIIQGKKAPFDSNDQVNLAFKTPTNGTYTIAIGAVDGLFTDLSQNIYLEDTQLNIIHDLRSAPYQFTTTQEENVNRFVLRYTNQTLSNDTFDYSNTVSIYANENVTIKSTSENIKNIKIYDVLGKTLVDKDKVNKNEVILTELKPTGGMLIVKATLTNGSEVTKKVIF
ncbi:GEVED domain-containing protein [Flavobacterium terrae]|nr:GEVED domain-containing protein [Flavobacterium terrae]